MFGVPSIDCLGHIISINGVTSNPAKIQVVLDWTVPQSLTTL